MGATVRFEIFSDDLDATVDFYARVLGFSVVRDERSGVSGYVALVRDAVHVGAASLRGGVRAERRPPTGVEVVIEVDDVVAERDRIVNAGWPLEEDLVSRPWGLTDVRLLDPSGYYLRLTGRDAVG